MAATVRPEGVASRDRWVLWITGALLVAVSFLIYWLCNRFFDAFRGDLFYLADAFLHGRTWLNVELGPNDIVPVGDRVYVPFAPFPAILFMPIVAFTGPVVADQWETGINAAIAAFDVGLCWWLLGRIGVSRIVDRLALAILLGFSTQVWWVTTRGGVWHTGHLVAIGLTFMALIELWGKRRPLLIGLLAGAAFLTRAPVAFAIPVYALFLVLPGDPATTIADGVRRSWARPLARRWILLGLGVLPSLAFFFWYNDVRFGSPFDSGYQEATLPDWLAAIRAQGLFSLVHLEPNLELLFTRLPTLIPTVPFFRPDGFGLSVLITSPGLFYAIRAPWRDRRAQLLLLAAFLTLVPNLLYYGGGWLQYGFRYALDAIPFVIALCGMAATSRGRIGWPWLVVIGFGVVVGAVGVYWAYNI
jgi:hypothetical protein